MGASERDIAWFGDAGRGDMAVAGGMRANTGIVTAHLGARHNIEWRWADGVFDIPGVRAVTALQFAHA